MYNEKKSLFLHFTFYILHSPAKLALLGVILMALLAPLLTDQSPRRTDLAHSLAAPSRDHPLGMDLLGRDVFSRVIYGGRQTLSMALGATGIAVVGGLILGTLAGSADRWWNGLLTSVIDALLAVPGLLIALVVVTLTGKGASGVMLAVGIAQIGSYARICRDAIHRLRHMAYVESAISIGVRPRRILTHYLLWNAQSTLITFTGVTFSWALLSGAALAFLGFTGDPSVPDWGIMLAAGRQTFAIAPWEALSAGIMLSLTVGAVNQMSANLSQPNKGL